MAFLFIGSQLCGILITFANLPEMLGMIGFGMLFTNLGYGNFEGMAALETILRYQIVIMIENLMFDFKIIKKVN